MQSAPILVVDDDHDVRLTLQWALEDAGLCTAAAADGREAIFWLAETRPALIVLDVGLPHANGHEVADAARARYGAHIPIIVITADGYAAEKAMRLGARDYVLKPFEVDQLVATVRRALDES